MDDKFPALDFVRYVLGQICASSDEVDVVVTHDDRGTLLTVHVNDADMGRLIGKDGQTISALRTLLNVMSARENKRFYLKIQDPVEK
ncbi:KH domain-containing protein [bacterium]|mgnify:CR=1 FL=1|jgi:uncharacterized protein|nr:KH domain-containing protein [bacterium]MBT6832397.1 KH domain-containing protein [bacterium]MBT6995942.1 KH domain-containing protein [bacterium]MBT7772803.1 KH domain-containing protein [bacterium]